MFKRILIGLVLVTQLQSVCAQIPLKVWPKGMTPEEIGLKVAELFVNSPYLQHSEGGFRKHISYFEVCTWYGSLTFAQLAKNPMLSSRLNDRFDPLMSTDSALLPVADHVDYSVFGTVPFEIYLQTKIDRYLELGKSYADKQWGSPFGPRLTKESLSYYNKGLTWQTRLWIDDMYMITAVQAQAYRATGDVKYINRAAKEMVFYLDELQKPNGLFYHAPDAPFFWGRGNGWMAAGMTELLRVLPHNNPDYPRIFKGYTSMMSSLIKYQTPGGSWRQLIDDPASWEESSCTGMFTFALITGVKNGWLDKNDYGPAARKGWLALVSYINDKGEVTQVCEGTGKKNDRQYYYDRKRNAGDMHGQAPVLWCASALLRDKEKQ